MQNVLVTGGRGFIGFNAIQLWHKAYPNLKIVSLDAETYADKFMAQDKNEYLKANGIEQYVIDLGCEYAESDIGMVVEKHNIDTIVNFAAESHVDNSIKNPNIFYKSNVMGVVHLLNVCNKYGLRFHQISTDEVIGSMSPEKAYANGADPHLADEMAVLCPSSPYSSSKAAAEMVCQAYFKTYGTKITISRCTNNFGPWQMTEKLIPTVISKAIGNQKIPIYADGKQRRFWIYVDEHNKAVMSILEHGKLGETYNIAPKFEWSGSPVSQSLVYNIDIVKSILKHLGKTVSLIEHVKDRPAHDNCYFLVASKIKEDCGYFDRSDFEDSLMKTVNWYLANLKKS